MAHNQNFKSLLVGDSALSSRQVELTITEGDMASTRSCQGRKEENKYMHIYSTTGWTQWEDSKVHMNGVSGSPLGTEREEEEKMKSKAMQETSTPKAGGPILAQKVLPGDPNVNL